jgi:hypothetical protein
MGQKLIFNRIQSRWVSENTSFWVDFKNVNLPEWQNAPLKKLFTVGKKKLSGAFCHLGKFLFLKSTQKDGHLDNRHISPPY